MYIYKITNNVNGKLYIGQTVSTIGRRWSGHICGDLVVDYAIRKYGKDNFECEIIDTADTVEELNEREIFWIKHYDSMTPKGYNRTHGGNNGLRCDETKKKLSRSLKGKFIGDKSPRSKTVYQFNPDGELIGKYESTHDAERKTGIIATAISACCRGEHKYTGKFMWSYEEKPTEKKFNRSYTYVEYKGEHYTIKDLSKVLGIKEGTLANRKRKGWTDEMITNTPVHYEKRNKK